MSFYRIVEGTYVDDTFANGVQQIFDLLWKTKDKDIVERFGLWLLQRDRALGLKVGVSSQMSTKLQLYFADFSSIHSSSATQSRLLPSRLATSLARFAPLMAMPPISTSKAPFYRKGIR